MKNKLTVIIIIILLAIGLRIIRGEDDWICQNGQWIKHGNPSAEMPTSGCGTVKPKVVEHFACSDYCPGPREKYMVRIYEGVEDEAECLKLGGKPTSYTGWRVYKICLAE